MENGNKKWALWCSAWEFPYYICDSYQEAKRYMQLEKLSEALYSVSEN